MNEKIRILFLSANPWTTSRILVDEEAREIFERIQEGPYRERFELHKHTATRAIDLQRLLLIHKPHIVHFSGHGSKQHKIILGGAAGRGKTIDQQGLVEVLGLYNNHLRLVLLNACFTKTQARSIAEVIDYSVGTGKGIGDKGSVAFAGAFYRALGFGKSIREAFDSAKAELVLTKMPRTQGIELFVRDGINERDLFPSQIRSDISELPKLVWKTTEERFEITVFETSVIRRSTVARFADVTAQASSSRPVGSGVRSGCDTSHQNKGEMKMPVNNNIKSRLPKVASASQKPGAKAAGTRVGTLQDWRGASANSGKAMNQRRNAFRDGR